MRVFFILFLMFPMLAGCKDETPSEPAKVIPNTQLNGDLKVLTNDDMGKLQEERKKMIDRPTPLNEEEDSVEALRKRMTEK